MSDLKQYAAMLNGNEYASEGSKELFAAMKADGVVAVFGASDDLIEMRGAVDDEEGAFDGGTVYFTKTGLCKNKCGNQNCPYFQRELERAAHVEAEWAPEEEPSLSWRYKTTIPHETFTINRDGESYCRGIVFALTDVPEDRLV